MKYLLVFKNTISEYFIYRLNFIMWRLRVLFKILALYFFWVAVFGNQETLFNYQKREMLTYILGTLILAGIILASRSVDIGGEINQGALTNYLLRPISYFKFWFTKDLGDKFLNIIFSFLEIILILFFLKPDIYFQKDLIYYFYLLLTIPMATILYFKINLLLGMAAFWTPEVWGVRFIFWILLELLSGGMFPLDILPKAIYNFFQLLPFPYLLFFPLKIYLGKLSFLEISGGIIILLSWLIVLDFIVKKVWQKGLKVYSAEGR